MLGVGVTSNPVRPTRPYAPSAARLGRIVLLVPTVLGGGFAVYWLYRSGRPFVGLFAGALAAYAASYMATTPGEGLQRFRATALQTSLNVAFILALIMALSGDAVVPRWNTDPDQSIRPTSDFMAFYTGGTLLLTERDMLFDVERQAAIQSSAAQTELSPGDPNFLEFVYPAAVATLFMPLALVDYPTAFFMMAAINLALLGIVVWTLARELGLSRIQSELLVICATALTSIYVTFMQGQLSIIVMLIFLGAILNIRKGNHVAGGVWTGLLAIKPALLPILLLWFLLRRKWRGLGAALAVAGGIAAASILLAGPGSLPAYLSLVRQMASGAITTVNVRVMPNVRALIEFLGWGSLAWVLAVLAIAAAFLLVQHSAHNVDSEMGLLIVSTILVAPHIHVYDLALLLIGVGFVIKSVGTPSAGWRWALILAMVVPTAIVVAVSQSVVGWPLTPVLMLGLWAALVAHARAGATPAASHRLRAAEAQLAE